MNRLLLFLAFTGLLAAQNVKRWSATTGDVSLSTAATAATIQQPATNGSDVGIDQIVVYCSAACTVSQTANGGAATTTAGTVVPILPNPLNTTSPVNFFTASNVSGGTAQGGAVHVAAGATYVFCLSTKCGNSGDVIVGRGGGAASNYTVAIASVTATVNITFYLRTLQ